MAEKKERKQITLYFDEWLEDFLGDQHSRPIRKSLALVVEALGKDTLVTHVQWTNEEGQALPEPILWWYKYWAESVERYERAKERSRRERVERFIFAANQKIIAQAVMRVCLMDWESANRAAFRMLDAKQWVKIKAMGVTRLITKEEEL